MSFKKYLILFLLFVELIFIISFSGNYIDGFDLIIGQKGVFLLRIFETLLLIFAGWELFNLFQLKISTGEKAHYSFGEKFLFALLANYKVIYIFTTNVPEFSAVFFLTALLAGIVIFFALFCLFKLFLKNESISLFIAFCFNTLAYWLEIGSTVFRCSLFNCVLIDIWAVCALLLIIILLSLILNLNNIFKFFKTLIIILLIFCSTTALYKYTVFYSRIFTGIKNPFNLVSNKKYDRDIYIILLDMYAGEKTLKEFQYNNDYFYKSLKNRDFTVYPDISSNYNKTLGTLVSIFNFNYFDQVPYKNVSEAVDKSLMFYMARESGYKIYYLNAQLSGLQQNPKYYYKLYSDMEALYNDSFICMYSGSIFMNLRKFFNPLVSGGRDNFILQTLNDKEHKKLAFFHLMMPHWPYLYDENGKEIKNFWDINNPDKSRSLNKESYISYLKYTNSYVLNLIDNISLTREKQPVIIIFGDHGVRKKYYLSNEQIMFNKLQEEDSSIIIDQFDTFLAYYDPDNCITNKELYKSLVNFYRSFANGVWGTNFNRLEDKRFYFYYNTLTGRWLH